MRVTRLDSSDYRRMPWKNGLGVTTEIARAPQHGDFDWRVSVADVKTDGPFSPFPGCDRVILTLEGTGMVLTHSGGDGSAAPHSHIVLGPLEPWTFSGDWTTTCALRDGPIRDFNVIARRAMWIPRMTVLRVEREMKMDLAGRIVLVYCLTGSAVIDAGEPVELERDCTLMLHPAETERAQIVARPSGGQAILIAVELSRR